MASTAGGRSSLPLAGEGAGRGEHPLAEPLADPVHRRIEFPVLHSIFIADAFGEPWSNSLTWGDESLAAVYGFLDGKRTGFDTNGMVVRVYEGDKQGKVVHVGAK